MGRRKKSSIDKLNGNVVSEMSPTYQDKLIQLLTTK